MIPEHAGEVHARPAAGEPADARDDRDYTPAVYGSLLVTTLIAVQWHHDATSTFVALTLVISVAVFWLTHVWAGIVNRRVRGPLTVADLTSVAIAESPMLSAAVIPTGILALATIRVISVDTALGVALGVSIVQLFLWGLAVGRAAHTSWPVTLAIATFDCALGLLVVVLKVIVLH